mgnify:CR=1 FL=1
MSEVRSYATLILLLALITIVYSIPSLYFGRMSEIWLKSKRLEVLRNEISYLQNQADRYREEVAPLVLRLFSYSREGDEVSLLYSGREFWRGSLADLNLTHEVKHFGKVRIWVEDGRVTSSILGMPYRYTLRTYYDEELSYVVQGFLDMAGRIDEAVERDMKELSTLEKELKYLTSSSLVYPFLATPLISLAIQFASLRALDPISARKYLSVLFSPYVLLPTVATYFAFASISLSFHWGTLVPLYVIGALYVLTSIPSLISPILYAYERIIE